MGSNRTLPLSMGAREFPLLPIGIEFTHVKRRSNKLFHYPKKNLYAYLERGKFLVSCRNQNYSREIHRRPFFVVIIFLLLYLNYTSIDAEVGAAPSEEKKPLPFKWKI
jgi:hypothetical protein